MDFLRKLPPEIWSLILSHIPLNELIRNRQVSRLFKQYCEEAKIYKMNLVVGQKRAELNNKENTTLDEFLFFKKTFKFFGHLKKLDLIVTDPELAFDFALLKDFNQLTFLQVLQIKPPKDKHQTLSLPELKKLHILEYSEDDYFYKVDAPKLDLLSVGNLKNLELVHPESVQEILCDECDYSTLIKFKNLEIMQCCIYLELQDDLLSKLKNLRELHIDFPYHSYFTEETFQTLKSTLKELLRQKELLKRANFLITWRNVQLLNADQLGPDISLHFMKNLFNFPMQNYRFLADSFRFSYHLLPDRIFLNYNYLVKGLAGGEIREDFFKKFRFSCVQVLEKVQDPEHFLAFLIKVPKLTGLNLHLSEISQEMLERLADKLADIKEFYFFDTREEIDLRFIFKFKQLEAFETNLDTPNNQNELLHEAGARLQNLKVFTVAGLTTRFIY